MALQNEIRWPRERRFCGLSFGEFVTLPSFSSAELVANTHRHYAPLVRKTEGEKNKRRKGKCVVWRWKFETEYDFQMLMAEVTNQPLGLPDRTQASIGLHMGRFFS